VNDSKTVLVTGLARNTQDHLAVEIRKVYEQLSEIFSAVKFLIVESDSSDKTLDELVKIKTRMHNFDFVSLGQLESSYLDRIERLTKCRNVYVDAIRFNNFYKDTEYIVVLDFDIRNNRLDLSALRFWLTQKNWAALFANQTGCYYDIYALRKNGWNEIDCFVEYKKLRSHLPEQLAKKRAIWSKMIRIPKNSKPIKVESAFGGLAIYRREVFTRYDYQPIVNRFEESEHVVLHRKIGGDLGDLLIIPNLTNFSWNPHNLSKYSIFRKFDSWTKYYGLKRIRKLIRKHLP